MKVNCHIHSLHSDGIYEIEEIIPMLMREQVEVFSITDHDTVSGIHIARESSKDKMQFISGIEFTCRELEIPSVRKTFSIHLLGYNFDETTPSLVNALKFRKQTAAGLFRELCKELTAFGYAVSKDEIPISCGNVLQLCDIKNYMRLKYPTAGSHVFDHIDSYSAKLNRTNLSFSQALSLIHDAGGKAVWAHPFYVYKDFEKMQLTHQEVLAILEYLIPFHLDGIEAFYPAFDNKTQTWLVELTHKYNLLFTAGSDFHGSKGRDLISMEI